MSCVHDACRQGRDACTREACHVEENLALPWFIKYPTAAVFGGIALWLLLELTVGRMG